MIDDFDLINIAQIDCTLVIGAWHTLIGGYRVITRACHCGVEIREIGSSLQHPILSLMIHESYRTCYYVLNA